MSDDPIRAVARRGLAPLVDDVPAGPEWDELPVSSSRRRQWPGWAIASASAFAVIVVIGAAIVLGGGPPSGPHLGSPPPTEARFDEEAARARLVAWWEAALESDLESAQAMAHPDASFNYPAVSALAFSVGDRPDVEVQPGVFGTAELPQICFAVTGDGGRVTGSGVFRRADDGWRLWEVRFQVERCLPSPLAPTSMAPPPPTVVDEPSDGPTVSDIPIDERMPLRVLAVRPNNPSFALIDLQTAHTTLYPPGAHALPRDAVDGAVMTPDRRWIIWTGGIARLLSGPLSGVDVVLGPDEPRSIPGIAPALRAFPTHDSQRVWLVQPGLGHGGETEPTIVELVETESARSLLTTELDPHAFPVAATDQGLVFNSHDLLDTGDGLIEAPGSHRVALLTEEGDTVELGNGSAVAATADRVVLVSPTRLILRSLTGDPDLVVDQPHEGTWQPVGGPVIPSDAASLRTVSPDGSRFLVALGTGLDVNRQPTMADLVVVDLVDGSTTSVDRLPAGWPAATWSADGRWIARFEGRDIHLIDVAAPETKITLADVIPDGHFPLAAG